MTTVPDPLAFPAPPATYPVMLITRWHQAAAITSLLLVCTLFAGSLIGLLIAEVDLVLAIPCALAAAALGALPGLLTYRRYPSKRTATVHADGVHFSGLGDVPYASLVSYNTDDYLKLRRSSGPTLLIMGQGKLQAEYPKFRDALLAAIGAWKQRQPPGQAVPERAHFYGSPVARLLGVAILAGVGFIILMLTQLRDRPISVYFILPMAIGMGIRLLVGGRKR
ncbi:hypothetical protein RAN3_2929 [plant metagenome]|uniref:Uncharacterized protein n=1 Tax=plant metagenome TaxID=1297885 RepID=A0A484UCK8_9ZZZZ